MSPHEPFKQVEGRRPDFEAGKFAMSKQPDPDWRPGQGLSTAKSLVADGRTDLPGYSAFVNGATLRGSQEDFRHIDPEEVENKIDIYKLTIGGIVPRPIAFVSTMSAAGTYNLAPFSYFAPMGYRPPLVMVHFGTTEEFVDGKGRHRDSLNNIKETRQFVINMISEPFVEAATLCCAPAPPDISEWDLSGLTPIPSDCVEPPRVGESAFCMECTLEFFHDIYADEAQGRMTATFVVGRVRKYHVRKDLFGPTDAIDAGKLLPVACMGGISYARVTDAFETQRFDWAQAEKLDEVKDIVENARRTGGKMAEFARSEQIRRGRGSDGPYWA